MTGKLYAKHGGVFIESGLHTSDFAELTESVKLLETENQELRDNNRRIHNKYIDVSHDREARHTVEFDTLRAEIKRLETENARLNALYDIAVGNIAWNSDDMERGDVRKMIELHYEMEREKRKAAI